MSKKDLLLEQLVEIWQLCYPGPENILKAHSFLRLHEIRKIDRAGLLAFAISTLKE